MVTSINVETVQSEVWQESSVINYKHNILWKRCFDFFISVLVSLSILTWLIPFVGILICLESRGPILFVQLRTGRNGRQFRCLKLRTMIYNKTDIFRQAVPNDNRVTNIGRFLRKTNLDELPQFLNVLAGDMSIVGPRPHAIEHDAKYWFTLPDYSKRYAAFPGITGLAQVRGARGVTDDQNVKMQHRLRYDLFYIKNHTILHDIQICWWTVKLTLKGDKNAC